MKKKILLALMLLIIAAMLLSILSSGVKAQSDPWWNTDWAYRKQVIMDNTAGGSLTDFQVKFVVPYASSMNPDFSDLRFTDGTGVNPLPYWIEKVDAGPAPPPSYSDRIKEAAEWIFRGQDVNGPTFRGYGGGVSYYYTVGSGWYGTDYQEVTGYIIPTILDLAQSNGNLTQRDRALSMADWLVSVQGSNGNFIGYIFDTGMALQGLLTAYRVNSDPSYLNAANKAANWIILHQLADGSYGNTAYGNVNDPQHSYHARVDWILLDLYQTTGNTTQRDAALNNLAWVYSRQQPNGWWSGETTLHFISYIIQGTLESGVLLQTIDGGTYASLGATYIASAKKAADVLLTQQLSDGSMSGSSYDSNWTPSGSSNYLPGDGQISLIWARFYQLTSTTAYLDAARKANTFLMSTQDVTNMNLGIRGAIDATWPLSNQKLSWSAKFFIDALMNTQEPTPPPPVTPQATVWVKVPSIPAGGTINVYMYYGNPAALSASNGNAVFDFFDDFSGDLSKWTVVGGTWAVESGELSAATTAFGQRLRATGITFSNGVVEARMKWISGANLEHGLDIRGQADEAANSYSFHLTKADATYKERLYKRLAGSSVLVVRTTGPNPAFGKWYDLKIGASGSSFKVSAAPDYAEITGTDTSFSSGSLSLFSWSGSSEHVHYDNVRIRKFALVEPTVTLGTEESAFVTITFEAPGAAVDVTVSYTYDTTSGSLTVPAGTSNSMTIPYGSTLSYDYPTTISGGTGIQYVLESTSPSSPLDNVISDTTVTGTYKTQYTLTIESTYDTPSGEGWYDADSTAYATLATGTVSGDTGIQYVFIGWSGDASGAGLTSDAITMDGPKTAVADWKTQYYLTVNNGGHGTASGEGWHDSGASVAFSVNPAIVDGDIGIRYVFTQWSGDSTSSNPSETITMDAPKTVTANWKTQYLITVTSAHGSPTPSAWVDEGNDFTASVTSPETVTSDHQWVCTGFSIDGGASQIGTSYTFIDVQAAYGIEFAWKEQFYLTMLTNFGTVSPASDWYDAGSLLSISATAPIAGAGEQYVWLGWTGSGLGGYTGTDNPASIVMNEPVTETAAWRHEYYLTISTNFGTVSPSSDWYPEGSSISIEASAPIPSIGERFVWNGWTGAGAGFYSGMDNPATVVMNGPISETSSWTHQYFLTVTSDHDTPGGQGWYDADATAYATLTVAIVDGDVGTRYVFTSWVGDATGAGLTSEPILMNGPKNAVADWETQYYLTIATDFGTVSPSSDWYEAATPINIQAFAPTAGAGERYVWNGWTGTGSGSYNGISNPASITLNGPITEIASWTHQYYLTVNSAHDTPGGQGWYDAGSNAQASLAQGIVSGGTGIQYIFTGWTGDASGTGLTSNPITMTGPKTATADWKTQYHLSVSTNPPNLDSPTGAGWYDAGTDAIATSSMETSGWTLFQWQVDGVPKSFYTYPWRIKVTMDAPHNAVVIYKINLQLYSGFRSADTPFNSSDPDMTEIRAVLVKTKGGYKLAGTAPGTYDYATRIHNTGTSSFSYLSIIVSGTSEFFLKGLTPVRVVDANGNDITSQFNVLGVWPSLTIQSNGYFQGLPGGSDLYVAVRLDYSLKGAIVSNDPFYFEAYLFTSDVSAMGPPDHVIGTETGWGTVAVLSKKTTIIYGFVREWFTLKPVEGAIIDLYHPNGTLLYTEISDSDGFFSYINEYVDDVGNAVALQGGITYKLVCTPYPPNTNTVYQYATALNNKTVVALFPVFPIAGSSDGSFASSLQIVKKRKSD